MAQDIFDELDKVAAPEKPKGDLFDDVSSEFTEIDESGFPTGISARDRKRMELGSEMAAARSEGAKLSEDAESLERQSRTIGSLTPRGVANLPGRLLAAAGGEYPKEWGGNYEDAAFPRPGPLVDIPEPTGTGVMAGVGRVGSRLLEGLSDPDVALSLPAGGSAVGRLAMSGMIAPHIPEQVERAGQVLGDIQSTPADITEAVLDPLVSGGMLTGLGAVGNVPKPPPAVAEAIRKGQETGLTKSVEALKKVEEPVVKEAVTETTKPAQISSEVVVPLGDQVMSMTAPEFMEWSKKQEGGITQSAYDYGKTLKTPEQISRLKELEAAAEKAGSDALASGDVESALPLITKKQFFTEALESAVGVAENKINLTAEQVAKAKQAGIPASDPVISFRLPDGSVVSDPSARIHAQAFSNLGLAGKGTVEPGFVVNGKFIAGSQAGDMTALRKQFAEAREAPPVEPPAPPASEPLLPEGQKMRKSAERATTSEQIPTPVQETIKTAPESFYDPQSMKRVEDTVAAMPDNELGAVTKESDLYTAAKLEQADRLFKAGNNEAGYQVFVELEKEGTRMGQLINQFKLLTGSRPEQVTAIVNQKLVKSGKDPLKPQQAETITSAARDSKALDQELGKATDEWVKNPTPENAKAAELALDKANDSAVKLQREVSKFEPRTTSGVLKSVLQGNLLTPISEVANIFGNMSFLPFRSATRTIASGLDVLDSFIRKTPREITVQPIRGTLEAAKGAGRGLAQVPSILAKGSGDVVKGESRAGLHPMRAWVDQFAKNPERPTEGGKLPFSERVNLAIEGTLGIPAEAMLRGLGAGDAPFREAARARVIGEQLKLKGVPKSQWSFAQKFPELFLDKPTMEKVRQQTSEAIFQRDSQTLNFVTRWIRGKGDLFDFAVATVAPYKLTPWNIIGEIMSYNPLVALAKTAKDATQGNTRAAKINASKFAIGSMMTTGAYWLYQKGLLSPSLDERDEAQKARLLAGEVLPPNHVNLSGLKRALSGGDPAFKKGDETVDVMRAGGLAGAMMYMTANIGRDFEKKAEVPEHEFLWSLLKSSALEQARFGMNQSFLQGVDGFLTAIKDGNTDSWFQKWANTVSAIPLPNTLGTLSRATRGYKPELKGETFAKQVENIVRNRLGFARLDDYLPLKRGLWGEPLPETPKDRNALVYQFFDISKNRQVTDDPVPLELYRLWRKTADTKVIPSLPTKNLTIARQNFILNPEQLSRYAELVGGERRRIMDAIVINPNFHELSDENKVRLLDRVYREGMEIGKRKFWEERQDQLTPKKERAGFSP